MMRNALSVIFGLPHENVEESDELVESHLFNSELLIICNNF
jgi:hypothetical protein